MEQNAFGCEVVDYPDILACGTQAEDYGHSGYFALSFLYFLACLVIFNFIFCNSYIGLVIHKLHDHHDRQFFKKKVQERVDHIKKNSHVSSTEIEKLKDAFEFLTHRQELCIGPVSLSFALEQGGYKLTKTQFDSIWRSHTRLHKDRMDFSEFLGLYLDLREFAGNDRTTVREQMDMFPTSSGSRSLSETKKDDLSPSQKLDTDVLSGVQIPPSALEWWRQKLDGITANDIAEDADNIEDINVDGRIGYNEEDDIANHTRRRKKVVTYVVLASDGINPKCIPHRKTPTLSVYGKGSFLTVRLSKTMPNDSGMDQLWLLTNYGWITDRVIGSKDKKTLTMLIHNEQPLSIELIGYELTSPEGGSDHINIGNDEYVDENGEMDSKGKRRPSRKIGAIGDVRFCIEIEVPTRNMAPYKDNIKTGVNWKQRHILEEKYDEMSVMRIHRTFKRLQSLDNELDIHESYLGVKFPESLHDIEIATSVIDLWLKAIVRTQQIAETPSLSTFLEPNEEDIRLMEIALGKEGGIDGTWKDIVDALDVDRQHVAGTVG